jgi:MFS family permease
VGLAFVLLKTLSVGVDPAYVPLTLVLIYGIYAVSAYLLGSVADLVDRRWVLAGGATLLVAGDAVLASPAGLPGMIAGAALWGLQMGTVHGALGASIAAAAPRPRRGVAFGTADLAVGLAALATSFAAGGLWVAGGPALAFGVGAAMALAALAFATMWLRRG